MHLGVEAVAMPTDRRGIGRYARQVLAHCARLHPDLQVTLYAEPGGDLRELEAELPSLGLGAGRGTVAPVSRLRVDPPEIVWYPWNKTKHFSSARRMVLTIHDLVPFHFRRRGWHRALFQRKIERRFRESAARADLILTDSAYSRQDIIARLGVRPEIVEVIPLAADDFQPAGGPPDRAFLARRFGISGRYLLYVGADEERKNLARLRAAFGSLHAATGDAVQLVICGARVPRRAADSGVLWVGRVSEDELRALYHGAAAFVQPSLLEGFGLPVLEAMGSGVPVVCSNTTSLPEVAGDAALYFDPLDVQDIAAQLRRCLGDDGLRQELVRRGLAQAARFRWEDTARRTWTAFERVRR